MSFWEPHNGANGQNVLKGTKTGGEIQKSVTTNVDELKLWSVFEKTYISILNAPPDGGTTGYFEVLE